MWRSEYLISKLYKGVDDMDDDWNHMDDMEEETVIVEFVFKEDKLQNVHRWRCTCMDKVGFYVEYPELIWEHISESTKNNCRIFNTIYKARNSGCDVTAGISGITTWEYGLELNIETHWELSKVSGDRSVIEKLPIIIVKIDRV
tara:strand:+ start:142 stop:573 length:432 start_codon:yes stop_codon:yes gene_type:complete